MMENYVNFSLGENFGELLTQIAREKIMQKYDGPAGVKIITDSLIGCPEDLALDVIFGKKKIEVTGPGDVEITDQIISDFSIADFIERKLEDLTKQADEWQKALERFDDYNRKNSGKVTMTIPTHVLFNMSFEEAFNNSYFIEAMSDLKDDFYADEWGTDIVDDIQQCARYINELFEDVRKLINLSKWAHEKYPEEVPEGFSVLPQAFAFLKTKINGLCVAAHYAEVIPSKYALGYTDPISDEHPLHVPVEITDNYDAGWLSPDGKFYGMHGEVYQMIHTNIAEALVKEGVVTVAEEDSDMYNLYARNPDAYLGNSGWIKIHHDNVLFEGYMWGSQRFIDLTEAQKTQLTNYGRKCYEGSLTFGPGRKRKTISQFLSMDTPMLRKLFDYDY